MSVNAENVLKLDINSDGENECETEMKQYLKKQFFGAPANHFDGDMYLNIYFIYLFAFVFKSSN